MLPSPPVSIKGTSCVIEPIEDEEALVDSIDSLVDQLEASLLKLERTEAEKKHWETALKFMSDGEIHSELSTKIQSTLARVSAQLTESRLNIKTMAECLNQRLDQYEELANTPVLRYY